MIQRNTIIKDFEGAQRLSGVHTELVADIIDKLQVVIELTTNDFSRIGTLLKKFSDQPSTASSAQGFWISAIITELQFVDMLKQKIDHMIFFLEEIAQPNQLDQSNEPVDHFKTCGLIFKLNFFQLRVTQSDLAKTVETIQARVRDLQNQKDLAPGLVLDPAALCTQFNCIIENMEAAAASLTQLSAEFPVTTEVRSLNIVHHLLKHYTMESEREILRWCMDHMEGISRGELRIEDLKDEQIQLF